MIHNVLRFESFLSWLTTALQLTASHFSFSRNPMESSKSLGTIEFDLSGISSHVLDFSSLASSSIPHKSARPTSFLRALVSHMPPAAVAAPPPVASQGTSTGNKVEKKRPRASLPEDPRASAKRGARRENSSRPAPNAPKAEPRKITFTLIQNLLVEKGWRELGSVYILVHIRPW